MKISVLLASRKNSKFLSKFIFNFLQNTHYFSQNPEIHLSSVELLVMCSEQDTWNRSLIEYVKEIPNISFFPENYRLGRSGLHIYYNELLQHATGDWIIYFCDDHCITVNGWDRYLLGYIEDKGIDHNKIYQIVPGWENAGSMNQMLSRGWVNALGNIGRFGNIDSYNNFVAERILKDRTHRPSEPLFYDFTHDPKVMTPEDNIVEGYSPLTESWESPEVQNRIIEDGKKLMEAIDNGL